MSVALAALESHETDGAPPKYRREASSYDGGEQADCPSQSPPGRRESVCRSPPSRGDGRGSECENRTAPVPSHANTERSLAFHAPLHEERAFSDFPASETHALLVSDIPVDPRLSSCFLTLRMQAHSDQRERETMLQGPAEGGPGQGSFVGCTCKASPVLIRYTPENQTADVAVYLHIASETNARGFCRGRGSLPGSVPPSPPIIPKGRKNPGRRVSTRKRHPRLFYSNLITLQILYAWSPGRGTHHAKRMATASPVGV